MNFVEDLPIVEEGQVSFNTAILTYPSDYDGLLSVGIITEFLESLFKRKKLKIKCVIAREDADDKIQRNHFHCYIDNKAQKQLKISPKKFFDIKLPVSIVIFVHNDKKKTREYKILPELINEQGWNIETNEWAPILASYTKENGFASYEVVDYAHPNLQIKKKFGSKYAMLRYVIKQNLVARSNFDVEKELKYLENNKEDLCNKCKDLIQQKLLAEINVQTIEECIQLCKLYKIKIQASQVKEARKEGREFRAWLRDLILNDNMTQIEVMREIKSSPKYWEIYSTNVINYRTLINDMFKHAPPLKPKVNYNYKFYVPIKLYNWLISLDDWVRRWHQGEVMEDRPKGLCLIGESKTGKTKLMTTIGDFTYLPNTWNLDNWENKTSYTIMDDIDPIDKEKGLSFSYYKPFFGAQDVATVTDKYCRKKNIIIGKPLIWLSNIPIEECFKSDYSLRYIRKNMDIIVLKRNLYDPPVGMEVFELKEFDPKTTWYYNNVVLPKQQQEEEINSTENNDDPEELEPLSERKRRLSIEEEKFEEDKGRPTKHSRTENSSNTGLDE